MGFDLAMIPSLRDAAATEELAACNEITAQLGLRLTADDMKLLSTRRAAALRATGRVEFGRGVLRELVLGFCESSFITQETYAETISDVQDVFYRCKDDAEAGEPIADNDLIEAMREAFDHEAGGSVEILAALSVEEVRAQIAGKQAGDYDEATQDAAVDVAAGERCETESARSDGARSGGEDLDRALDKARRRRPDGDYAADFYAENSDLYRARFDANSRIGGSTLG